MICRCIAAAITGLLVVGHAPTSPTSWDNKAEYARILAADGNSERRPQPDRRRIGY